MYKNIDKQAKLCLKDLVDYRDGQIVSRTLVQNNLVSMTLFSFDKGEEISTHAAGGDAMVTVLEGTGRFTVGGDVFILTEGETLTFVQRLHCHKYFYPLTIGNPEKPPQCCGGISGFVFV